MERKLTAILCADVFGYSRLIGEDEKATLHTLTSYRKIIDSLIDQHRGRFVNSAGDSVLAADSPAKLNEQLWGSSIALFYEYEVRPLADYDRFMEEVAWAMERHGR